MPRLKCLRQERLIVFDSVSLLLPVIDGGYQDEAKWPEIQDEMIDAMIDLAKPSSPKNLRGQTFILSVSQAGRIPGDAYHDSSRSSLK